MPPCVRGMKTKTENAPPKINFNQTKPASPSGNTANLISSLLGKRVVWELAELMAGPDLR